MSFMSLKTDSKSLKKCDLFIGFSLLFLYSFTFITLDSFLYVQGPLKIVACVVVVLNAEQPFVFQL